MCVPFMARTSWFEPLIGIFAMSLREATLYRILFVMLSFSAGSILGTASLDLLPKAVEFFGEKQHNSELIPKMQKEQKFSRSAIQFGIFLFGVALIYYLSFLFAE